MNQTGLEI